MKHINRRKQSSVSGMGIIMFEVWGVGINQSGVNEVWLYYYHTYYCHLSH